MRSGGYGTFGGNSAGNAFFANNFYMSGNDFKYTNTHSSLGYAGIAARFLSGGELQFYTSPVLATTKDVTFTPTPSMVILSSGNVGIGTTTPTATLSVSGGNVFINDAVITSGTPKAAVTKEYLDSALGTLSSVPKFVGVTASAYNGTSGGNPGYGYANSLCAAAFTGSHVCTTYEMLNTINASSTMPTVDVWVHAGPPGYTALANDCDGRRNSSSSAYGTYWQMSDASYAPSGRGLLMTCNNSLQYACCK